MQGSSELRVALGGFGAIGGGVARRLDQGLPGLRLVAVSARDRPSRGEDGRLRPAGAGRRARGARPSSPKSWSSARRRRMFREIAEPAIQAGRVLVAVSVGQLLERDDLIALRARDRCPDHRPDRRAARPRCGPRRRRGRDLERPDGHAQAAARARGRALPRASTASRLEGLDARSGLRGQRPRGARGFPANVNVAAALSLAGIGPDRTGLEIWADPGVSATPSDPDRGRQRPLRDDRSRTCRARPTRALAGSPPLSVIAALKSLTATLRVGS